MFKGGLDRRMEESRVRGWDGGRGTGSGLRAQWYNVQWLDGHISLFATE